MHSCNFNVTTNDTHNPTEGQSPKRLLAFCLLARARLPASSSVCRASCSVPPTDSFPWVRCRRSRSLSLDSRKMKVHLHVQCHYGAPFLPSRPAWLNWTRPTAYTGIIAWQLIRRGRPDMCRPPAVPEIYFFDQASIWTLKRGGQPLCCRAKTGSSCHIACGRQLLWAFNDLSKWVLIRDTFVTQAVSATDKAQMTFDKGGESRNRRNWKSRSWLTHRTAH